RQHRTMQEITGIAQTRVGFTLELRGDALQSQLRGHLAFRMAAHAIGQHKQGGISGVAVAHAIFVGGTAPTATELEDGKFHGVLTRTDVSPGVWVLRPSPIKASSCKRTFSDTLSGV